MKKFKLYHPRKIISNLTHPCDLCGKEVTTVGFYLKAASGRKVGGGFYSDLSIKLCRGCLTSALNTLEEILYAED